MNRASACINLNLISAIKIANSNFSNSGLLVKDIDESTFRISLWNLLSEIPQIAEPKSRHLVPIILDFRSVISDHNLILVNRNKNCARFVGSQADATYFRPSIELNPIYIIGHNYHGQIVADISFHKHNYSRSKSKGGNKTS